MKQTCLLFILMIICVPGSFAQYGTSIYTTAKTSTDYYLTAMSTRSSGVLNDSEIFTYSSGRGIAPDGNDQFDHAYHISPITGERYIKVSNTFDAADRQIYRQCEWVDSKGIWNIYYRQSVFYNADGTQDSIITLWEPGLETSERQIFHYNALKFADTISKYQWDTTISAWQLYEISAYMYNGKGKAVYMQTDFRFGSGWISSNPVSYIYDASDTLLTVEVSKYKQVFYQYDAKRQLIADLTRQVTAGVWKDTEKETYSYDLVGRPLTYLVMWPLSFGGPLDTISRTIYHYNSHHLLTEVTGEDFDTSTRSFTEIAAYRYYYDNAPLDITAVTNIAATISLYPVPAHDMLNMELKWNNKQGGTATVYDLQGRIWQHWDIPAGSRYTTQIPTGLLPSGNYVVAIEGQSGDRITQTIAVAH